MTEKHEGTFCGDTTLVCLWVTQADALVKIHVMETPNEYQTRMTHMFTYLGRGALIDADNLLRNASNKMEGWMDGFRTDRYVIKQVQ